MSVHINFEGQPIYLSRQAGPTSWWMAPWMAPATVVMVDGQPVIYVGGHQTPQRAQGKFVHNGRSHSVELVTSAVPLPFMPAPYVIRIDRVPVHRGRLPVESEGHWAAILLFELFIFVGLASTFLLAFILNNYR
jgi:hypothetical protein